MDAIGWSGTGLIRCHGRDRWLRSEGLTWERIEAKFDEAEWQTTVCIYRSGNVDICTDACMQVTDRTDTDHGAFAVQAHTHVHSG